MNFEFVHVDRQRLNPGKLRKVVRNTVNHVIFNLISSAWVQYELSSCRVWAKMRASVLILVGLFLLWRIIIVIGYPETSRIIIPDYENEEIWSKFQRGPQHSEARHVNASNHDSHVISPIFSPMEVSRNTLKITKIYAMIQNTCWSLWMLIFTLHYSCMGHKAF